MKYAFILPALLAVSACSIPAPKTDPANECIAELAAEGTYQWNPADPVPTVVPKENATQRTADNINACIRAKTGA
ncbi:MAG: hypothetical protein RIE24_16325 [Silicimonas sp.]